MDSVFDRSSVGSDVSESLIDGSGGYDSAYSTDASEDSARYIAYTRHLAQRRQVQARSSRNFGAGSIAHAWGGLEEKQPEANYNQGPLDSQMGTRLCCAGSVPLASVLEMDHYLVHYYGAAVCPCLPSI